MKNKLRYTILILLISGSTWSQSFIEKRISNSVFINQNCVNIAKFSTSFQHLLKCLDYLTDEIDIKEFENIEEYYIYAYPKEGYGYSGYIGSCQFLIFNKNLDYITGYNIRYSSSKKNDIRKISYGEEVNISNSDSLLIDYIDNEQVCYIKDVLFKYKSQNIKDILNEEETIIEGNNSKFGEYIFHVKDYGVTPIQAFFFDLYIKKIISGHFDKEE